MKKKYKNIKRDKKLQPYLIKHPVQPYFVNEMKSKPFLGNDLATFIAINKVR